MAFSVATASSAGSPPLRRSLMFRSWRARNSSAITYTAASSTESKWL